MASNQSIVFIVVMAIALSIGGVWMYRGRPSPCPSSANKMQKPQGFQSKKADLTRDQCVEMYTKLRIDNPDKDAHHVANMIYIQLTDSSSSDCMDAIWNYQAKYEPHLLEEAERDDDILDEEKELEKMMHPDGIYDGQAEIDVDEEEEFRRKEKLRDALREIGITY